MRCFLHRLRCFLLACGAGPALALASCPPPEFTAPENVRLKGDAVLIVTHASSFFDPRHSTKYGVDAAVRFAKYQNIPVVYLVDDESPFERYFAEDCKPTYWVRSRDGEVPFKVPAKQVYLAGGHLELCLSQTIHDLTYQRANKRTRRDVTYIYVMDAIYSNGKLIDRDDPYYADFDRFMGVVTYGRPGGEAWPKLNLLETIGIIQKIDDDYRYLTKALPHWERTFARDVRIELQLDDLQPVRLQAGSGFAPMTVKFQFVDSADLLPH